MCFTAIRLAGGSNVSDGRVELFISGHWGTVCDDRWSEKDAEVVCRQLGLAVPARAVPGGIHNGGVGPVWSSGVQCLGSESSIFECNHVAGIGHHDGSCNHTRDARVQCSCKLSFIQSIFGRLYNLVCLCESLVKYLVQHFYP